MARIAPVDARRRPLLRLVNAVARRVVGREPAPLQVLAHQPGFLLPYLATTRFVRGRGRLDPGVRALAMQLVAEINGCAWCVDFGRYAAQREGVAAAKLVAVAGFADDSRFSPAEHAALAYAEAISQVGAKVADDLFAELRRHFSDGAIVELTVAVAMEHFYNRLNVPLGIEAQGFCAAPWVAPQLGPSAVSVAVGGGR